ncbi:MAG: ABC transporter ATP-binding protein [Firmicutes bacterium]|nr:ABC transporter ATP-binding protein [Bacillota bacterium]
MKLLIKDICFSYGSHRALDNVSLEVHAGEVVSLVGPNGSGKSTMLRCIAHVLKPQQGAIYLDGREATRVSSREMARLLGYVPQLSVEIFPLTVFEAVLLGRKPYITWGVSQKDKDVVARVLKFMGIEDLAPRFLDELSGGEKQKVLIARALAQEPEVFLFDEPTSSLDIKHQLEVLEVIRGLAIERGCSVVMVLHDLNLASRFSDKMLLLRGGKVFAAGRPETALTPENIEAVYGVEARVTQSPFGPSVLPIRSLEATPEAGTPINAMVGS